MNLLTTLFSVYLQEHPVLSLSTCICFLSEKTCFKNTYYGLMELHSAHPLPPSLTESYIMQYYICTQASGLNSCGSLVLVCSVEYDTFS